MIEGPPPPPTALERFARALTLGAGAPALPVQLAADRAVLALKPSGALLVALGAAAPSSWDELGARAAAVLGTEKPDVLAGILPDVAAIVLVGANLRDANLAAAPQVVPSLARPVHWIVLRPDGELLVDSRAVPGVPRKFLRAIDDALRAALGRGPVATVSEAELDAEARFRALMSRGRISPWTLALVVACFATTSLEFFRGAQTRGELVGMGALVGRLALHGHPEMLLSYGFLHGGFFHVMMNMLALDAVGRPLEKLIGGRRMLVVFTLSVLGGGLLVSVVHPEQLVVGASAGIFGLITALLGIALRGGGDLPELARARIRRSIVMTLLLNLGISLLPSVSLLGHLGGSIAGLALGMSGLLTSGLALPWRAPPAPARAKRMAAFYALASTLCVAALAVSVIVAWTRG